MNGTEKKIQRQQNFQNGKLGCYSLKAIIPLLIFLWPIGMFLLIKRIIITKDFPKLRKNAMITLIAFVLFITVGIFTLDDNEKEAYMATDKTALASQEIDKDKDSKDLRKEDKTKADKKFKKELMSYIDDLDSKAILELYQSDLSKSNREELIKEVEVSYKDWLATKMDSLASGSTTKIEPVVKKLAFLNQVEDADFQNLKEIKGQIDSLYSSQKEINKLKTKYDENVSFIDVNSTQDLSAYVVNRVASSTHINIAGIDLTDKYTDQFQITSYDYMYGTIVPTDDWQGVISFKTREPSSTGVIDVLVSYIGTEEFADTNGFKKELPVYIEVTQEDIDYSNQRSGFEANIDLALELIQELLK